MQDLASMREGCKLATHALRAHAQHRPRFDRGHGLADGRILLHVNGTVDGPVPDRRLVGPVHHVDLDLNCSREDGVATVLGYGLQPVALALSKRKKTGLILVALELGLSNTSLLC